MKELAHPKRLMVGTDVSTKGGIASVINDYIDSGIMRRLGIAYVATHKDGGKLTKMLFFLKQLPRVFISIIPVEIVHIHTSHGWSFRRLVTVVFLARLLGKKVALHVHGSQFDTYFDGAGRAERAVIRYGLRVADIVIALSQDWKEKLSGIQPGADIIVIRNGVDIAKYLPVVARELHKPATVLFLGRLGERKGIYDLLSAIQELDSPDFKFVLAGDGEVAQVRSLVKERGLGRVVQVPGWVGPEEKRKLLSGSDIYVLPSYHEGLPISILEAMAAGLPVISTPVGGIPEAVIEGETGYLCSPGDHIGLADAIRESVSDPVKWKKMSTRSIALAQSAYSMEVVEAELIRAYERLV